MLWRARLAGNFEKGEDGPVEVSVKRVERMRSERSGYCERG